MRWKASAAEQASPVAGPYSTVVPGSVRPSVNQVTVAVVSGSSVKLRCAPRGEGTASPGPSLARAAESPANDTRRSGYAATQPSRSPATVAVLPSGSSTSSGFPGRAIPLAALRRQARTDPPGPGTSTIRVGTGRPSAAAAISGSLTWAPSMPIDRPNWRSAASSPLVRS